MCDADVCASAGFTLIDFATACLEGGARLLQVRAKSTSAHALLDSATEIVRRAQPLGATVIVNDRADVAKLAGASGVHVGQDDLAPADVRIIVGANALVGLSTHTTQQIADALHEPVSYIAVGPVFGTSTKDTGYGAVGVVAVRQAATLTAAAGLPLVAIGGITLERAQDVLDAGAASVAVITDLLIGGNPRTRVREYVDLLRSSC